jgi:hypothetical protein
MSPGAADAPTTSYSIEIVLVMCLCMCSVEELISDSLPSYLGRTRVDNVLEIKFLKHLEHIRYLDEH